MLNETAPIGLAPQHTADFDSRWKKLTSDGNNAHEDGNTSEANGCYALAYHEARMIFANAWNGDQNIAWAAAPMMVVSAANAARNWEADGRPDMGINQLTACARIFIQCLKSTSAHQDLKAAVAQHMSRLLAVLNERRSNFPKICDALSDEATNAVLACLTPSTEH